MEAKPDGRMYSRILRRIVAIVQTLPQKKEMSIGEMAEDIHKKKLREFYLERFKGSMSVGRVRDYIRYLRDIKALVTKDDKFALEFPKKKTDQEWAQSMSDRALEHLAEILKRTPDKVPDLLESRRKKILRSGRVPTLDAVIADLEIEGGRAQELFRWSLYVYTDGPTCPFDLRRHPVLSTTVEDKELG